MIRSLFAYAMLVPAVLAQVGSVPLESVVVQGSAHPKTFVMEIAGLSVGAPVDKAALEQACGKLRDSGLFQSISYRYSSTPKRGYVLTLALADEAEYMDAVIDIPGADEDEAWRWLASLSPMFDRKSPRSGAAQAFLARQLERHATGLLHGQHLVAQEEADLSRGKHWVSIQPETLPRISQMTFGGQQEISAAELIRILTPVIDTYTERRFRNLLELNVRPAYENRGMYRVRFPTVAMKPDGQSVSIATTIEEGPKFALGEVRVAGAGLPVEAMLKAGQFDTGLIANWSKIQKGIWNAELVVKRTGHFQARAKANRLLDDNTHTLNVEIQVMPGPLFRFGELRLIGLSPREEAKARSLWRAKPGDPYDYRYPDEFIPAFYQVAGSGAFKQYAIKTDPGAGDHVMDITIVFTPK